MSNLFPHHKMRLIQSDMFNSVKNAIKNEQSIIIHAPTGIGKTAAAIAPALEYGLANGKSVFFLTSRHTQHKIVIETLKKIEKKHEEKIIVADIIGKKWFCPHVNILKMSSTDFVEFCKKQKENNQCEYHTNTIKKNQLTVESKIILDKLEQEICNAEEIIKKCDEFKTCPYEILMKLAAKADVIIADYYYVFNPMIQENFFGKTGNELEDAIVIVDEGHNLPGRIRELMTSKLSSFIMSRAKKEVEKYHLESIQDYIYLIDDILVKLAQDVKYDKLVTRDNFIDEIRLHYDYQEVIAALDMIADEVREKQRSSFIGSIAQFMENWLEEDEGFTRIIETGIYNNERTISLTRRCLDPSLITKDVIQSTHSTILMSGTLSPTSMYKDLLGFSKSTPEKNFLSPFPADNKKILVIPKTTTKFSARSPAQFKEIAKICAEISNEILGNIAIFFPSYRLLSDVNEYFSKLSDKTIFTEKARMSQSTKNELLERFKSYNEHGAVLLGVAAANFSEGIDLPGDLLNGVIVVGLPLQPPTLEIKELIKYYDKKFGNGWDYGYVLPAITKSMQAAGRCIRTETDKGVIAFLDQRYTWPNYFKCFPSDWDIKITIDYLKEIKEFYK